MNARNRAGFTLISLLVIIAVLAILLGLLLPAVQKVREASRRMKSQNNLKQIALGYLNYESTHKRLPPGLDEKNYSAFARLLPYLEPTQNLELDLTKPLEDAPEKMRNMRIEIFESDRDPQPPPMKYGPTSYLFVAGSLPALKDNNGVFFKNSKVGLFEIVDGTSNTIGVIETLRGDGGKKAVDVKRQHVALKADALAGFGEESGVADWNANRNIAGDRGASWMDGRFLQGTFTATRAPNDANPDVACGGDGGLSAARTLDGTFQVAFMDGSVRAISVEIDLNLLKALATRNGGEVVRLPE